MPAPAVLTLILTIFIAALSFLRGQWVMPDSFLVIGLIALFTVGRVSEFIKNWLPFIFILFIYQYLTGAIPHLIGHVNTGNVISWEAQLFGGQIPTLLLQKLFFRGAPRWYDFLFTFLYYLHFVTPLAFAYLLWFRKKAVYRSFIMGLVILSYAAFITYCLFPSAPPWLASKEGYLPPVARVQRETLKSMPRMKFFAQKSSSPSFYNLLAVNQVAAIPSLHAAYPFLILLFAIAYLGRAEQVLFLFYSFVVWVGVVYMGEHYVVDVLLGISYAILSFLVVTHLAAITRFVFALVNRFLIKRRSRPTWA